MTSIERVSSSGCAATSEAMNPCDLVGCLEHGLESGARHCVHISNAQNDAPLIVIRSLSSFMPAY